MNNRMMRRSYAFIGLLIASQALAAPPATDDEIRKAIQVEGPKQVVAELWSTKRWDAFMDRISSGDEAAIALAPEIAKGTDAGSSEDLTISLADALVRNPRAVLRILDLSSDSILNVGLVCSAPFIEDSDAHERAYKTNALKAVRSVYKSPDVRLPGGACIAQLKQIRAR